MTKNKRLSITLIVCYFDAYLRFKYLKSNIYKVILSGYFQVMK